MTGFSRWFKNRSFRTKLLFSFLLLSLLPLVLMSIVSVRLSYNMIYKSTQANAEMVIDRVQEELDALLQETLSVADSIAGNAIIQEALQGNFNPEHKQFALNAKAAQELLAIFQYRKELFGIAVIGENGQTLISTDRILQEEDFRRKYWYREVLQYPIPPVVFPPHPESYVFDTDAKSLFSLAIPVEDRQSSLRLGVILIDIEERVLKEMLHNRLGEWGYLFIQYNRSGFTSSINQAPDSEYLIRLANNEEIEQELLDRNREMVLIRDLTLNDVKLASVVSLVELTRDSRRIGSLLFVLILGSMILSILMASLLSSSIARPVHQMRSLMLLVQKGDLSVRMSDLSSDELGDLGRSFNQMVQRIDNLMENVKEDQIQLRKAELRTLQAQINPHFLYNTLDSINWLSREGRNEDIIAMVTSLTTLFRTGISRGQDMIPISAEISHIESYLTIQKIRYENRFIYEMDVDESVLNCMTLKLILQPLVENALYHGIKMKKGKGLISIRARKVNQLIILEVSDNGAGMSEERLLEVRQALEGTVRNSDVTEEKTVYGIKNVHDRLKIYYGDPYGLLIHSRAGEGTTVTLKIPETARS
ncbi:MAG: sensor histidine kinase [Spirochaetales bacterium]|nr:sensor histidine kinase [Spirochaetales bacterium]